MLTFDQARSSVRRSASREPARWSLGQVPVFPSSQEADSAPLRSLQALTPPRLLQPKLVVGGTGDSLERQADEVADHVAAGAARPGPIASAAPHGGAPVVSRDLDARLRGLEGRGAALPASQQAYFGERFGVDFSRVRVHTGAADGALAGELRARAFTLGDDIVFGQGQYAPGTPAGDRLIAHELTHVVQQAGGAAMRPRVVQRDGIGEWWDKNVSKRYSDLKEQAYQALIDGVRAAQKKAFGALRAALPTLPASLQGPAGTLVSIAEEAFGVAMTVVLTVIGIGVGFGEGIVDVVKGLVQFLYALCDLLVRFVAGFFSARGRRAFDERASEIVEAVKGVPAGLKKLVDDWLERFKKAPTERQSLMIGELTGQVLAFIATFEVAAAKAAQLPKLTIPAVVVKGDQLAVAVATVNVGAPVAAGVMVGTTAMMTTGSGKGTPTAEKSRAERLEDLSRDPDKNGQITEGSRREAEVALALEDQGRLKKPVRRPVRGDGHSGDFVDGAGKDWDVKSPRSRAELIKDIQQKAATEAKKPPNLNPARRLDGEFDLGTVVKQIEKEIRAGEGVIIDTSRMEAGQISALRAEVTTRGLDAKVIFYP